MEFRCGLIGLGRIGCGFDDDPSKKSITTHAGAYYSNKNVKFVALCDIDQDKLSRYGEKYHIKSLFTDHKELFKKTKLDLVSICTHADSHLDIIKEAAKNNVKGIFLEKPISSNLEDAAKIIQICNRKNIKLQVDHQRRFSKFYTQVKNFVAKNIGDVKICNIFYGGGILNTGTHVVDLARFFFGDIQEVSGTASRYRLTSKDFNINGIIKFKNGCVCNLQALDYSTYRTLEFDMIGENGRLRLDMAKNKAESYLVGSGKKLVYGELEKNELVNKETKEYIVSGLENLILAVKSDKDTLCTGLDGYKSLEGTLRLIKSMKSGGKILQYPLKQHV